MKFLVLGAAGMAGHTIAIYLKEQQHEVVGFSMQPISYCKSITGDATHTDELRTIILDGKYDAVINCVGILNQFAEDGKANAVFLNAYLPHMLAEITENTKTQIIHMSTDCVFSGKRGQYTEDDFPDGTTFYDRSKALGELNDDKNITIRTSIIGPDINPGGIGLLNWFMKQKGEISGYTHAMWTGLTTLQLAKVMEAAAREKAHGLYNMVYTESISKYHLLKLINHYLRNDEVIIKESASVQVDKSLKRTRFDFNYIIPEYETMVREMSEWVKEHKWLYPHYDTK